MIFLNLNTNTDTDTDIIMQNMELKHMECNNNTNNMHYDYGLCDIYVYCAALSGDVGGVHGKQGESRCCFYKFLDIFYVLFFFVCFCRNECKDEATTFSHCSS